MSPEVLSMVLQGHYRAELNIETGGDGDVAGVGLEGQTSGPRCRSLLPEG